MKRWPAVLALFFLFLSVYSFPIAYLLPTAEAAPSISSTASLFSQKAVTRATTTLDIRVSVGTDDAEEDHNGIIYLDSSDLELVADLGGNQTVGMRFTGVTIPQGATITSAYVQFQADETKSVATSLNIQAEDVANAGVFTSAANDLTGRFLTTASIPWSPVGWNTVGEAGTDQQTPDIATVIQEIIDLPGWASGNSLAIIVSGTGERVAESYEGDSTAAPLLHVVYDDSQGNQTPVVAITAPSDGSNFTQGDNVTFTGTATDAEDGNLAANLTWNSNLDGALNGGTAAATFATTALTVGAHTITASVTDSGSLPGQDSIIVNINSPPVNTAPTVNAGLDQNITLPADATLNATVTDDGLVAALTFTWSKESGPGTVTFANANVEDTTASFSTDGTYVLRLTAFDGELTTFDNLTINVAPLANTAPVVNAGLDQNITLPADATLNATVTDDGLVATPTFTWSKQSGPGTVTFANANAEDTTAGFSAEGAYVLRLTVFDGELTTFDELTVTVAPPANTAPVVNAGLDQNISFPADATLNATVTDDGLVAALNFTWSKESGPGTVIFANANAEDTTASFSAEGTYVLRLTVFDGELTTFDELTIITNSTSETILDIRVSSSVDDAEEDASGPMYLDSSDLEIVADGGGDQTVGMRFTGVTIPQGATITSAYVQFQADETKSVATSLNIQAEDVANAGIFTSATNDLTARFLTTASVPWSPVGWDTVGEAGVNQQTPDIASVIQEIVDLPGWASGNSLAIIISGTGERVAESYDGDSSAAPLLHVVYQNNQGTAPPVIDPNGGSHFDSVDVNITTITPGATIHFTTDGSTPTTASSVFTAPVTLTASATVKAIAVRTGFNDSSETSAVFDVQPSPQVDAVAFGPSPGTFQGSVDVTLSTTTPGATIHYTLDGTPPTTGSPVFTTAINLTETTTVRAFAVKAGFVDSSVGSAVYTEEASSGDPIVTAPPNVAASTEFLYTGTNPIQTGVVPGTIDPIRAAMISGQVLDQAGNVFPGVTVTILDHPEFGQTVTQSNGFFNIVVNGGSQLIANYELTNYLSAQRQVDVPWHDYVMADDVTLVPIDAQVTTINLAAITQVTSARGSVETDNDGTRQTTLLFKPGTTAEMLLSDDTTQALTAIDVRVTEYSVGSSGETALPAILPANTAYTYAVDLNANQAISVGAKRINFNQPVPSYVENFLNIPTGTNIPSGYYDRIAGVWIPSANGRVIKILSITAEMADLDVDGSGLAANSTVLTSLGIDDGERTELANLYSAGQVFLRVPINHFSSYSFSWSFSFPR